MQIHGSLAAAKPPVVAPGFPQGPQFEIMRTGTAWVRGGESLEQRHYPQWSDEHERLGQLGHMETILRQEKNSQITTTAVLGQ